MKLRGGCGNTNLCTPGWWEEGGELRGISRACPLHPCHHLPWWHQGSVSFRRAIREAVGSKIFGAGKTMLLK